MTWYPGWDSLESVKAWHIFWEVAGIIILALLVGAEILAFQYSHRKDFLTDEAERSRVEEQQRQEGAAETRRKAEVEGLQRQLADADKKAAEAAKKAEGVAQQIAPRHLSEAEKTKLIAALRGQPTASVTIKAGTTGGDERGYADEIAAALRTAAWQVQVDNAIHTGPDTSGLWMLLHGAGGEAAPPAAVVLFNALRESGLPIRNQLTGDMGVPPNEIWLCVGKK